MLSEIIDKVGYDNILKSAKDVDMRGKMFRINIDGTIDLETDYITIEKKEDVTPKNQKLYDWFKEVNYYSRYLNSNKAIVPIGKRYPKLILSNQDLSIMFNNNSLIGKANQYNINYSQALKECIEEFCNVLNSDKYNIFIKNLALIYQEINNYKGKIFIFINENMETFKDNFNKYMKNKIFDGKVKDNKGTFSYFATSNAKKTYLFQLNNKYNNSAYVCDIDSAKKIFDLNKSIKNNKYIQDLYKGEEDSSGNIKITNFYNYSKLTYNIFQDRPIYLNNGYIIDTPFKFKCYLEDLLGKDNNRNDVKKFKEIYSKNYENVSNNTIDNFKKIWLNIIKQLILIGKRNLNEINNLNKIVYFKYECEDYLFNKNNMEDIKLLKDNIIGKINNLKDTKEYKIDNDMEYNYLLGSLISYITSLSKSDNNRAKFDYANMNKLERIKIKLKNDIIRYGYQLNNLSRGMVIYSAILNYNIDNLIENEYIRGLFEIKNVMYVKKELTDNLKDNIIEE